MTRIIQAYGSPRAAAGDVLSIAVPGSVDGGLPPITYTNQWHSNGIAIADATADSFTVRDEDEGKRITCVTTAVDAAGRTLILKPSNEILVGDNARGPEGPGACPPKPTICCTKAPPLLEEPLPDLQDACEKEKAEWVGPKLRTKLRPFPLASQPEPSVEPQGKKWVGKKRGSGTAKPQSSPKSVSAPAANPKPAARPTTEQIKREMRKAGGCKSCGGRRRR